MTRIFPALAAAFIGLATAWPAQSQTPSQSQAAFNLCGQRSEIVQKLAEQFKENPMAVGQVDKSAVLEVFVSEQGSWTIIATGTDGRSCVVSAGEGWQSNTLIAGRDA